MFSVGQSDISMAEKWNVVEVAAETSAEEEGKGTGAGLVARSGAASRAGA